MSFVSFSLRETCLQITSQQKAWVDLSRSLVGCRGEEFTAKCNFSWQIILVPSKQRVAFGLGWFVGLGGLFLKVWVKEGDLSHFCWLDLEG